MKWHLSFAFTLMLMLLLPGCKPTTSNQIPLTPTTENLETIVQISEEPIQNDSLVTKYPHAAPSIDTQSEYRAVLLSECAVNIQTKYEVVIESYHEDDDEYGMDIDVRYPVIKSDEYVFINRINEKLFSASYRNDEGLLIKPESNINVILEIDCEVIYSDNEFISVVYYGEYYRGLLYSCTIDLLTGEYVVAANSVKESELQQKVVNEEYTIIMPFIEVNDSLELQQYIRAHFSLEENEFYSDIKRFFEFYSYSLYPEDSFRTQNGVGIIVESRGFIGHSMILIFDD